MYLNKHSLILILLNHVLATQGQKEVKKSKTQLSNNKIPEDIKLTILLNVQTTEQEIKKI